VSALLLSIVFASSLFVILKLFQKWRVNIIQALVANYITAASLGFIFYEGDVSFKNVFQKEWFPYSFMLGFLFISVFYVMALTSQKNGISVASVATKMSVVIPILSGIIYFKESLTVITLLGILLALTSVYLTSKKETGKLQWENMIYPVLVFLGAGTVDTCIKFLQHYYVKEAEIALFSATTFGVACLVGIPLALYDMYAKKSKPAIRNVFAGVLLGIPNFFSLVYMIKMLASNLFSSAVLFTIHNIAIVVLTTVLGVLFFKERLYLRNGIGIVLAIMALFLMTQSF